MTTASSTICVDRDSPVGKSPSHDHKHSRRTRVTDVAEAELAATLGPRNDLVARLAAFEYRTGFVVSRASQQRGR